MKPPIPRSHGYEIQVICDECGRLVSRRAVDAAAFERAVEETDPPLPPTDPATGDLAALPDLVDGDIEGRVEVLVQHVAGCRQCTGLA